MVLDPIGDGDGMGFRVTASGINARIPQAVPGLLSGESTDRPVDAHAIQPFFAGMLARACGLNIALHANGDGIVLSAEPAAAP
jgi:histidine phosphotransferase ChpT